jgi:hypothetical protein
VEYQRAAFQRSGGAEQWAIDASLTTSIMGSRLNKLGFMRRAMTFSPAEKITALEELAALDDETQAVRWLLKRGVPAVNARSWRETREQGRLVLPAGADLAQARKTWELPQLSLEQKRHLLEEYVTTLSGSGQVTASQWLRDHRLTWWDLDDWYREPGVVPDQDRDAVAAWFDGPGQATEPVPTADHGEIDAGEVNAGPVPDWGQEWWGLDQLLGADPMPVDSLMPAPQMPAGPSHPGGLPVDLSAPAAAETGTGAFPGTGHAGDSSSGGSNSADGESLYHQLFQEDGEIRPEILSALDAFLNGPDLGEPGPDGSSPNPDTRPADGHVPPWQAMPWWQTHYGQRSHLPARDDHVEIDAGETNASEVNAGPVPDWGQEWWGLDPLLGADPMPVDSLMPAPQMPAGPSHPGGLPVDLSAPAAAETGTGAFAGTGHAEAPPLGGPDSPNAELLCHQLFQQEQPVEGIEMILRGEQFLPESLPVSSPVPPSRSNPFDRESLLAGPGIRPCGLPSPPQPARPPSGPGTASTAAPDADATVGRTAAAHWTSDPYSTPPAASPTPWWTRLLDSPEPCGVPVEESDPDHG